MKDLDKNLINNLLDDFDGTIKKLEIASDNGDLEASYSLGNIYYFGEYCESDYDKALKYLSIGEKNNHIDSIDTLGRYYRYLNRDDETYKKSFDCFKRCLELDPNYGDVKVALAHMQAYGMGTEKNVNAALETLSELWNKGVYSAGEEIGDIYFSESTDDRPLIEEAAKWYQRASFKGANYATISLGKMYVQGYGVEQNSKLAYNCFKKTIHLKTSVNHMVYNDGCGVATKEEMEGYCKRLEKFATDGDSFSAYCLGKEYESKDSIVGRNVELSKKWYSLAAEYGNIWAAKALGFNYHNGWNGYEENYNEAYKYLRIAAEAGDDYAMNELADLLKDEYISCIPYDECKRQTIYWYEKAVEAGNDSAMYSMGLHYYHGSTPFEEDHAKSLKYFEMSKLNDITARYIVDICMEYGPTQDFNKAYKYAEYLSNYEPRFAGENGNHIRALGYCYLGKMYKDGLGVARNLQTARSYFEKSSYLGNEEAKKEMAHIQKSFFGWKVI